MSRSQFDRYYAEALQKAQDIKGQRGEQYNREDPIRRYWVYGLQSIYHCIWAKALRIRSLLGIHVNWIDPMEKDGETLNDSLLDIINYAAFLYAENMCRWMEYHEKQRSEYDSELSLRFTALNNAKPSSTPVERVVLDEGQGQGARGNTGSQPDHEFNPVHESCPSCLDVLKRTRAATRDGAHDVGNLPYTTSPSRTDGADKEGRVFLRDYEGGGQK